MLVGAVMGFWAVQRVGGPARRRAVPSRSPSPRSPARRRGADPRVPRDHAAREPDRLGPRADDLRGAAGLSSYLGNDFDLADDPARHSFEPVDAFGLEDLPVVGPIAVRPDVARLRLVGLRRRRRLLPLAHAARPQRPRRRRVAGRGRRDGHQRHAVPLPPHARRRRLRRRRRRVLQPRAHAAVGRRPHRRAPAGSRSRSSSSRSGAPTSASSAPTSSAPSRRCRSRSRRAA